MFSFERKGCSFLSTIQAKCNFALGIAAVQPWGQVFHSLTGSAIHLAPVANLQDQHAHHAILDAADDAVIADPVSP